VSSSFWATTAMSTPFFNFVSYCLLHEENTKHTSPNSIYTGYIGCPL
jgi:hypothetical protein